MHTELPQTELTLTELTQTKLTQTKLNQTKLLKTALRTLTTLLLVSLVLNPFALAQTPQISTSAPPPSAQTPSAPIPTQIAAAHTIFLVNAGADANFPLTEDQSYNQVYAALQSWGRFQLVGSAAQADLIFNLHDIAPITDISGNRGSTYSISSPAFQLTIMDAKTNTPLWTITSPVTIIGKGDKRARWNAIAVTNLISRVKVLVNQPLTTAESADLTTVPKVHGTRNSLIVIGAFVGVSVGFALLGRHLYENSLNKQKQQQDAFCIANNIPLSECAGG
jgi:hypothetical protein